MITGVAENMSADTIKSYITVQNGSVSVADASGNKKSGNVATGDRVRILNQSGTLVKEFTVILYGDVNGDGQINLKDALLVRKVIMGEEKLSGIYAKAADANRGNDGITLKDAFTIRKHILGEAKITQ